MEGFRLANVSLAVDILKMFCEKSKTDNFIFSPLCISSALTLTFKGAKGNTSTEIEKVLHFEKVNDYDFGFQTLTADISRLCSPLKVVKKLYVDSSHKCTKEFLNSTKKPYPSELESIDIKSRAEEARNQINASVKDLTDGHMETVLDEDSLNENTNMVLLGASYLKGCWLYKYNESETKEAEFHISKTETKPVQMMHQEAQLGFRFVKESNLSVVEIPFEGKQMSMLILLPKTMEDECTGLEKLEKELTYENYANWTNPSMLANSKVKLSLPTFKIESCYDLKDTLNSLGIKDAFNEEAADFSGMSESKGLSLSQAICKAAIEINEDGYETPDVSKGRHLMPKTECVVNSPFIFIVRHNKTQSIFLCGRYRGPSQDCTSS
ncbi:PREDICTED: serpin B5 [Nanorana parkeri]|uniref:serpin B5 n=1 Tax=Nanorana parkeri TaxID=125878 RepID=UPI000854D8FB|nr:PREDICTED: serpin B5 [Nanorana parkeri]